MLISWSIRHPFLVILSSLALAASGFAALAVLPVDAIPDLSENQVIVFADWMGHSPREVEDQLTAPLSASLQGTRGARVVRSSSDANFATLSVIFEDDVDIRKARRRVAERLAGHSAAFPDGVTPYLAPEAPATGQIYWYTVEGRGHDLGALRSVQDWYIKPQLSGVPGVAEVASVGGFPVEYQVNVDPAKLRAKNVTLGSLVTAVARSNGAVGGGVIVKGNAEFLVRGANWLGGDEADATRVLRDLEDVPLPGTGLRLADVASVAIGPGPRRGILEKDGSEAVGGVVLMAFGENPLEVTRRITEKVRALASGLPPGVSVVPFYDRTPLIEGAIATVSNTVAEAMLTATLCVLVVLLHARAALVIVATLPVAALAAFAGIWLLRRTGIADVQTNVMSLAGIAISVGVLVDSSVVMVENAMHALRARFGDEPVRGGGDVDAIVGAACRAVGRPIVASVGIMLLSFLPVFALGGLEGKMFRPLAVTKSLALVAVAGLAVTLVPALCSLLLRGRMRDELASPLVRGAVEVYRPVLAYLMDRPAALAWILTLTFSVGLTPVGSRTLSLAVLGVGLVAFGLTARRWPARLLGMASLVLVALVAGRAMTPLGREFLTPLDEGMVMDMPITVPRASAAESADDLKARDMILCRFPEVEMVVGKAGRAETPTDPAPLDMIETMVNLRPADLWPRRALRRSDALRLGPTVLDALVAANLIRPPAPSERPLLIESSLDAALPTFDAVLRESAYQRNAEFLRRIGPEPPGHAGHAGHDRPRRALWREHLRSVDAELLARAAPTFARLMAEDLLDRLPALDPRVAAGAARRRKERSTPVILARRAGHHGTASSGAELEPIPGLDDALEGLAARLAPSIRLERRARADLTGFGGELDRAVAMPGWTNVWTMPIQNRVDMLATGINTAVGARVLGPDLDGVARASESIAAALRRVPGAADVVADPVRGKGYLEIRLDRRKAARLGVSVGDANDAIEAALAGTVATTALHGRERRPVRVRYARARREDEQSVRSVLVPAHTPDGPRQVPLAEVASIRIVEGPATIKGEGGLLRNYVRLNVRGRDPSAVVADAQSAVASLKLPPGVHVEWAGQFEHEARARRALTFVIPAALALILLVLYKTYDNLADALLMALAVPGALAGGVLCQWALGTKFSVAAWVGYIACFGMATSTGIIMLVYLRDAVTRAGGLASLTPDALRTAVLDGAVHRLRPKLLTEGTTILGLTPLLWADGVGAEVLRPMVAPVLGGLLVADEVIDLLLPVLFYRVRRWRWERMHASPE